MDDDRRTGDDEPATHARSVALPVHAEELSVSIRRRETLVSLALTTETERRDVVVDLSHDRIAVEHVPIGRPVDVVPPVRVEGETTIYPVVEEIVVVEKRLLLREEIRVSRIAETTRHQEAVSVRAQRATVTRTIVEQPARGTQRSQEEVFDMAEETIVAIYETRERAEAATDDLRAAGIAHEAISLHSGTRGSVADDELTPVSTGATSRTTGIASAEPAREKGFWSSLFGGEPDHDTAVYDRSIEGGSTVLTVRAPDENVEEVLRILERHHPVDVDDRAAAYRAGGQPSTASPRAAAPLGEPATGVRQADLAGPTAASSLEGSTDGTLARERVGEDQVLQLAAEEIVVGKRLVNRGGTRIRRFVVETPVERQVSLHDEKVVVERRPVTGDRPAGDVDFSDKVVEMTETTEEPVITKTARVVEEIGLRKEAVDRTETIRDTVRREDVEIEKVPSRGSDELTAPDTQKKI